MIRISGPIWRRSVSVQREASSKRPIFKPASRATRALASGTVVASFTIESFGLERLRSLRGEEIGERMERFRHAARVG